MLRSAGGGGDGRGMGVGGLRRKAGWSGGAALCREFIDEGSEILGRILAGERVAG